MLEKGQENFHRIKWWISAYAWFQSVYIYVLPISGWHFGFKFFFSWLFFDSVPLTFIPWQLLQIHILKLKLDAMLTGYVVFCPMLSWENSVYDAHQGSTGNAHQTDDGMCWPAPIFTAKRSGNDLDSVADRYANVDSFHAQQFNFISGPMFCSLMYWMLVTALEFFLNGWKTCSLIYIFIQFKCSAIRATLFSLFRPIEWNADTPKEYGNGTTRIPTSPNHQARDEICTATAHTHMHKAKARRIHSLTDCFSMN